MKHYNTTRNIKRKLRNLTRRIKAGRKSRLLFKTGDLGKNLSKMTKKVTQSGGSGMFSWKKEVPGKDGRVDAQRTHVDVMPEQIARVITGMAAPIQLALRRDATGGAVWVWTPTTEQEFKTAFADAVKYNKIQYTENKRKFVEPRPARLALEQTARAAYADDGRKRAAASPPPEGSVEQDRASVPAMPDFLEQRRLRRGAPSAAARARAPVVANTDNEEKEEEPPRNTDFNALD